MYIPLDRLDLEPGSLVSGMMPTNGFDIVRVIRPEPVKCLDIHVEIILPIRTPKSRGDFSMPSRQVSNLDLLPGWERVGEFGKSIERF